MSGTEGEIHLGDGVYVGNDGYQIWIGANSHRNMQVALEPNVLVGLMIYIDRTFPHSADAMISTVGGMPRQRDK